MLSHDDVMKIVRRLAKGNYYQAIYKQAKEINLKIFVNEYDLTDIQIHFLTYLSFYSNLYTDCTMGEVSELVFEDEIYEDAYFAYKIKNLSGEMKEVLPKITQKSAFEYTEKIGESSWVFKKDRKKK